MLRLIRLQRADQEAQASGTRVQDWAWQGRSSRLFSSTAVAPDSDGAGESGACPAHECRRGDDDSLFCGACGALLPAQDGQSYFQVLGLADGEFRIDDSALDRQYKALQRQLHPDKFSSRPPAERERSEEASALVNQAFSTLKSPLKRAEYILQQRGIEAGEGTTIMDEDLLMGVMEAREAVDATQSEAELRRFASTFQAQADGCIQGLTEAFASGDLQQAKELTTLLRYITRIQTAILDKL